MTEDKTYIVYLLINTSNTNNYTYLGITNNSIRRLRQHNGEIKGGAKYTHSFKGDGQWIYYLKIKNLNKSEALSIERTAKNKRKKAIGKNPIKSVKMMSSIVKSAEKHINDFPGDGPTKLEIENSIYHAVAKAAVDLAEVINASLIISFTASGNTAMRIARERPHMPIYAISPSVSVNRNLKLVWGTVTSFQEETGYDQAIEKAINKALKEKFVKKSDNIIIVSGMPFGLSGSTNTIRVTTI